MPANDSGASGALRRTTENLAQQPLRWLTANAESIVWREWDGETVVYLSDQASTHLLGGAAGAVLQALLGSTYAMSIDELAARAFGTPAATEPASGANDSVDPAAMVPEAMVDVGDEAAPAALRGDAAPLAFPALGTDERAALQAIVLDLERIGAIHSLLP